MELSRNQENNFNDGFTTFSFRFESLSTEKNFSNKQFSDRQDNLFQTLMKQSQVFEEFSKLSKRMSLELQTSYQEYLTQKKENQLQKRKLDHCNCKELIEVQKQLIDTLKDRIKKLEINSTEKNEDIKILREEINQFLELQDEETTIDDKRNSVSFKGIDGEYINESNEKYENKNQEVSTLHYNDHEESTLNYYNNHEDSTLHYNDHEDSTLYYNDHKDSTLSHKDYVKDDEILNSADYVPPKVEDSEFIRNREATYTDVYNENDETDNFEDSTFYDKVPSEEYYDVYEPQEEYFEDYEPQEGEEEVYYYDESVPSETSDFEEEAKYIDKYNEKDERNNSEDYTPSETSYPKLIGNQINKDKNLQDEQIETSNPELIGNQINKDKNLRDEQIEKPQNPPTPTITINVKELIKNYTSKIVQNLQQKQDQREEGLQIGQDKKDENVDDEGKEERKDDEREKEDENVKKDNDEDVKRGNEDENMKKDNDEDAKRGNEDESVEKDNDEDVKEGNDVESVKEGNGEDVKRGNEVESVKEDVKRGNEDESMKKDNDEDVKRWNEDESVKKDNDKDVKKDNEENVKRGNEDESVKKDNDEDVKEKREKADKNMKMDKGIEDKGVKKRISSDHSNNNNSSSNSLSQKNQGTTTELKQLHSQIQEVITRRENSAVGIKLKNFKTLKKSFTIKNFIQYTETSDFSSLEDHPKKLLNQLIDESLTDEFKQPNLTLSQDLKEYTKRKIIPELPSDYSNYAMYEESTKFNGLNKIFKERVKKLTTLEKRKPQKTNKNVETNDSTNTILTKNLTEEQKSLIDQLISKN